VIADRRARPPGRARSVRALIAVVGLVLALVAANACTGDEPDVTTSSTLDSGSSRPTAPGVECYTAAQADPAAPITVSIGAQFAIVLAAEPTTGYSWQPVAPADPALLLTVGTEFRGPGEACNVDEVTQVLRYVGRAPGTATIALHYSRPAAASEDDTTVTFTVNVVDPTTTTTPPPVDTSSVDTTPTTKARSTTTTRPRTTTTTEGTTTTT
jgi:predicted secreted protein